MSEADLGLEDVLGAIWLERREDVLRQVATVEAAVADALVGALSDEGRSEAAREAHRIAGSVGTFGFEDASARAREVELALAPDGGPAPSVLPALADHVLSIRAELEAGIRSPAPAVAGDATLEAAPAGPEPVLIAVEGDRGRRMLEAALARGWPARLAREEHLRHAAEDAVAVVELGSDAGAAALRAAARVATVALVPAGEDSDRIALARLGVDWVLSRELRVDDIVEVVGHVRRRRSLRGTSVVAIADAPDLAALARAALADAGARVTSSGEPFSVFELLERTQPELVVVAGADSTAVCGALRATPRWQALPVVLVAAPGQRDPAEATGADAVLIAPITAAQLVAAARRALRRARTAEAATQGDVLTGTASRDRILETAHAYRALAERTGRPLAVGMFDVDALGEINRRLGPAAGDAVLRALGRALDRGSRAEDLVGRWAEDRFMVLWFGLEPNGARRRLDALMDDLRRLRLGPEGRLAFTVSAGLASYPADGEAVGDLLRAAERALAGVRDTGGDALRPSGEAPPAAADVVVVEDDDLLAALLEHALSDRGYRTIRLADGAEAAARLAVADADVVAPVVLLDWDLPGLDGLRVLNAMRAAGALEHTRVVMLTARGSEEEVVKALDAGAVDHVNKPFSVPVLMRRVRAAMER